MKIVVKGEAEKHFRPEKVRVNLTFKARNLKYDKVVEEGINIVEEFLESVLYEFDMEKEDLKANVFCVKEDKKYNCKNREYVYTQIAYFEFEYAIKKISKFIKLVSKLNNPPEYELKFKLKNEEVHRIEVLKEAFNNAKERAECIAEASGLKLKKCKKVSSEPNFQGICFDNNNSFRIKEKNVLNSSFISDEIIIKEQVYCLWKAK